MTFNCKSGCPYHYQMLLKQSTARKSSIQLQPSQIQRMLLLLPLLLVPSVVVADQMPAEWLGKYQLETSQGFSAFMTEIGVNWFTRQVIFSA